MLIITYSCSHNHPGPDIFSTNSTKPPKEPQMQPIFEDQVRASISQNQQEQGRKNPVSILNYDHEGASDEARFHYIQPPINCSQDTVIDQEDDPFTRNLEKTDDTLGFILDEEPLPYPQLMCLSTSRQKSEENDFFDELGELPTSSSFTNFMRSSIFDEGIPIVPS